MVGMKAGRQSEVRKFNMTVFVYQNIVRLDVASS